jgi:monovalent cation/hydrogen antiporter
VTRRGRRVPSHASVLRVASALVEPLLLVIGALAAIVVAALLSRRTGVATPLVLLVVGLGAGLVPAVPDVVLHPEVVLAGVLPPLLYATAVKVPVVDLRRNLSMISWLSITLVLASAVAIGALVHLVVPGIPFAAGVALGAVVSPTDAVAATAVGKRLGLPHRIMTVLEGESLFNDATALVLLRTALAALLGSFSLGDAVVEFFRALIVAIVVGLLIGWATVRLRARLADPVLTTAVSFVVPFLAYLPAEALDASGVVSVVVAGIVTGHMGAHRFSARERSTEQTNWTTLQFLVENGVFLLMGLQLPDLLADVQRHHEPLPTIALLTVALVLVLLLRRVLFVGVQVLVERSRRRRLGERREQVDRVAERVDGFADQAGDSQREQRRLSMMLRRVAQGRADLDFYEREPIGARGGAVIAWAGMRGVVTLAAAQTIPAEVETRWSRSPSGWPP